MLSAKTIALLKLALRADASAMELDAALDALSAQDVAATGPTGAAGHTGATGAAGATGATGGVTSAYTPASAANWNNSAPATIQAALDRIAAKITPIT